MHVGAGVLVGVGGTGVAVGGTGVAVGGTAVGGAAERLVADRIRSGRITLDPEIDLQADRVAAAAAKTI